MNHGGNSPWLWHTDDLGATWEVEEVFENDIYEMMFLPGGTGYLLAEGGNPHVTMTEVGVADDQGRLKFRTIFPGCYRGRYPHMHLEVYPNLQAATDYRNRLLTSQLAMPAEECRQVYASVASYRESVAAFEKVSLERDGIFRDNTPAQLTAQTPVIDGDVRSGFKGRVTIGLAARA